jgi:hypothetical protein
MTRAYGSLIARPSHGLEAETGAVAVGSTRLRVCAASGSYVLLYLVDIVTDAASDLIPARTPAKKPPSPQRPDGDAIDFGNLDIGGIAPLLCDCRRVIVILCSHDHHSALDYTRGPVIR